MPPRLLPRAEDAQVVQDVLPLKVALSNLTTQIERVRELADGWALPDELMVLLRDIRIESEHAAHSCRVAALVMDGPVRRHLQRADISELAYRVEKTRTMLSNARSSMNMFQEKAEPPYDFVREMLRRVVNMLDELAHMKSEVHRMATDLGSAVERHNINARGVFEFNFEPTIRPARDGIANGEEVEE